jgi:hypothetical protein
MGRRRSGWSAWPADSSAVPSVRAKDVGSGVARAEIVAKPEELLLIRIARASDERIDVVVHWDHTQLRIPVTLVGPRTASDY